MASIIRFLTLAGLLVGSLSITLFAQTSTVIPDTEAEKHIGQNVTVEGVVTAVSTSRKGNTFINFGGVYPNQTFTGWIPAGTPLATDDSISTLQGKKIKITGRIELYHGKPEIRVLSKSQITAIVQP
jgi:DNA/RNA endonuclease YhcR with UshA esterase domain